jgi:hypothetical protein
VILSKTYLIETGSKGNLLIPSPAFRTSERIFLGCKMGAQVFLFPLQCQLSLQWQLVSHYLSVSRFQEKEKRGEMITKKDNIK